MALPGATKQSIVTFSNLAIFGFVVAGTFCNWNQDALDTFVRLKLPQIWPCLLVYPTFLVLMPMLSTKARKEKPIEHASAPTISQAWHMAVVTATIDYVIVGSLLLGLDYICRLENGNICPFSAAGSFLFAAAIMPIKDEVQCRFLWRDFISPHKLNSWPYTFKISLEQTFTACFAFLGLLALNLSGLVSFENAADTVVLFSIYRDVGISLLVTDFVMQHAHVWMHEKAYVVHKMHHQGNRDLVSFHASIIDLFDLCLETGSGFFTVFLTKTVLGIDPRVHYLTHCTMFLLGFQHHSGNPYAPYFFFPPLDYLVRAPLCHNLHHAIKNRFHFFVPYAHLLSSQTRRRDIILYNKRMKTKFPACV